MGSEVAEVSGQPDAAGPSAELTMKLHALSIGIDRYPSGNALQKCVADAKGLAAIFGSRLLLDRACTRDEVLGQLNEGVKVPGPKEWGICSYSGHGSQAKDRNRDEPDGMDETIVTVELDEIIDDEFMAILRGRAKNAKILVVTDSCFSGTVHRAAPMLPSSALSAIAKRKVRYIPPSLVRAKKRKAVNAGPQAALPNVVHISGCTDFEFSFEGTKNGVLTGALIAAYKPGLTIQKWFDETCKIVAASGYPQHPQLNCSKAARNWKVPAL